MFEHNPTWIRLVGLAVVPGPIFKSRPHEESDDRLHNRSVCDPAKFSLDEALNIFRVTMEPTKSPTSWRSPASGRPRPIVGCNAMLDGAPH
jgi:hypothetical protein